MCWFSKIIVIYTLNEFCIGVFLALESGLWPIATAIYNMITQHEEYIQFILHLMNVCIVTATTCAVLSVCNSVHSAWSQLVTIRGHWGRASPLLYSLSLFLEINQVCYIITIIIFCIGKMHFMHAIYIWYQCVYE